MQQRVARAIVAIGCVLVFGSTAFGQVFTGRIDITAKDSTGAVLPGVTVELSGVQAATGVTDSRGEAHFLNLAPGRYIVVARLTGFGQYRNEDVAVTAGSVIALPVALAVGGVSEAVNVTAETPVIEAKRQSVSTSVSLAELQGIPTARDPWVILQTVPSVIVDRVNVGGAESGQQSNYKAKGPASAAGPCTRGGSRGRCRLTLAAFTGAAHLQAHAASVHRHHPVPSPSRAAQPATPAASSATTSVSLRPLRRRT
jgi:hypothetical protein